MKAIVNNGHMTVLFEPNPLLNEKQNPRRGAVALSQRDLRLKSCISKPEMKTTQSLFLPELLVGTKNALKF